MFAKRNSITTYHKQKLRTLALQRATHKTNKKSLFEEEFREMFAMRN
tara:strand:- start:3762 stop:3902 length:141 start_codon:yes stop_codon:yes gene_type:complete